MNEFGGMTCLVVGGAGFVGGGRSFVGGSHFIGGSRFVGGGHFGHFHRGFGHRRFGFGLGFGGFYPYYAYSDYYDGCWRLRHVPTRYGWVWRRINVCGYSYY